jgi:cyclohexanone monooxygenase
VTTDVQRVPIRDAVDAVVIGAGFCGLYATWKLTSMGLTVRSFDAASDAGGVWYWNRYPGAQTDSPQHTYQFTIDPEFLNEPHYSMKFPRQPEVLRYLQNFATRFGLRRLYSFSTKVLSAHFDESTSEWEIRTDRGDHVRARYLVTGLGLVSEPIRPHYRGLEVFEGEVLYTASWPHDDVSFEGKRVALVGTGSSGIQITSTLARSAGHLTVFQRTPNYAVPTGNRPVSDADREEMRERYDDVMRRVAGHPASFPFEASYGRKAVEATEGERLRMFEQMWERGGFSLLYESFDDIAIDETANEYLCEFFRNKICSIVKDPATAEALLPTYPYGSKRPPTGDGFYEAFNQDNVDLVSLRKTPIVEFTTTGVRTSDTEIPLDVIVFATGFDAGTGAFDRIDIRGRNGRSLREHWAKGPSTYMGVGVHGFPNLLMVAGPQSPFSNLPPGAELEGGWVADLIHRLRADGVVLAEPTEAAEAEWNQIVRDVAESSFALRASEGVNSWFTGANVEGKAHAYNIYFGGAVAYAKHLADEAAAGYPGYAFGSTADEIAGVADAAAVG